MDSGQLRAWRALLNLTQAEAAAEVGIKLAQYSKYERGLAVIPQKIEQSAGMVAMSRAEKVRKIDGRFKKPINWRDYGKLFYIYSPTGREHGGNDPMSRDPARRDRYKDLATALVNPAVSARRIDHDRSYETDDEIHVYLK